MRTNPFFIFALFTLCVAFASCSDDVDVNTPKDRADIPLTLEEDKVINDVYYQFGIDVFKSLIAESKNENIVFSPASLFLATSIAANGANGDTREEILNVLGCEEYSIELLNALNKKVIDNFYTLDNTVNISIANSVWYNNKMGLPTATIKNTSQDYYYAPITGVNDLSSVEAMKTMNEWVKTHTNGEIPSIFNSPLSGNESIIMANALYFKGQWKDKFDVKLTTDKEFYSESKAVSKVPTMKNPEINVLGYSTDTYTAISLPYGNEAFTMLVVLPDEGHDLSECLVKEEAGNLRGLAMHKVRLGDNLTAYYNTLNLEMPKFNLSANIDLKDILIALGMKTPFDTDKADFSNFFDSANFVIGAVNQGSKIIVDENGTTAASVSYVIGMDGANFSEIYDFIVNRPFAFIIAERSTGIPLFMGKISNL